MILKKSTIMVAMDSKRGFAKDGKIPWKIPADMKRFSVITDGIGQNAVLMGRRTRETLPGALKNRWNMVLSGSETGPGFDRFSSMEDALDAISDARQYPASPVDEVFFIGGLSVYEAGMALCERILYTDVDGDFGCDTFFPEIERGSWSVHSGPWREQNGYKFRFCEAIRK